MKLQPIKDVIVNQKRYQISKMRSDIGSWLLFKLIDSLRKIMQAETDNTTPEIEVEQTEEQKKIASEGAANAAIKVMLMNLDEELFAKVQKHALGVCGEYRAVGEEEVILPVLMANGNFAIPELATDIQTVVFLTSQSLFANLSPFFLNGGFNNL